MMIKNAMEKRWTWIMLSGCIGVVMLLSTLTGIPLAQAQVGETPLAPVQIGETPLAPVQVGEGRILTFADIDYGDVTLGWLTQEASYWFSLPTNWIPQPGNYVQLDLDYAVVGGDETEPALLTVRFNSTVIHIESFVSAAARQIRVQIPAELVHSAEDQDLNHLSLELSINGECQDNLLTVLTIRGSSLFYLNYTEIPLSLDLSRYPYPLYQREALTISQARIVLPVAPSVADMQTAVMVATKLGELSSDRVYLDSSFTTDLPIDKLSNEHLLVIGQPQDNLLVGQLALPIPPLERQLELHSEMPATIVLGQPFSYTVWVKNTSSADRILRIEDVWPQETVLESDSEQCSLEVNVLRCDLGRLDPDEEVAKVLSMRVDDMFSLGMLLERTTSLLDNTTDEVLNVDTLQTKVALAADDSRVTSESPKNTYFFVHHGRGVSENDGLIQAVVSPWSARHAAIVVTGINETGLLKAGQALASETQFPGMLGQYAIIQGTQSLDESTSSSSATDITFDDLGYNDKILGVSVENLQYNFRVSRGWALVSDATMDLHFSHSATLNVMSATMDVYLNSSPIYSTFLNEENEENVWHTIYIPAKRMSPGVNRLSIELNGDFPACIDPRLADGIWVAVYEDSSIHIPHATLSPTFDLTDFPRPFIEKETLSNVLFVMPEQIEALEMAGVLRLASALGYSAGGDWTMPQVVLGSAPITQDLESHIVAVGRPTQNAFIASLNTQLPQPFIPGTDQIQQRVDNVVYRLAPDRSLGFVQELPSPLEREHALLVVTGSTEEGVVWALDALTDDVLRYRLDGDLATLVEKDKMRVTDTRGTPTPYAVPGGARPTLVTTMTPEATVTPTPDVPTSTPTVISTVTLEKTPTPGEAESLDNTHAYPIWLAPLLVLALIAVVVSVVLAFRQRNA